MPYNTRRKSLSLPSLGIQLPNASRAHRPSPSKPSNSSEAQSPPSKKIKRSHAGSVSSLHSPSQDRPSTSSATSTSAKSVSFAERPKSSSRTAYEHTPPPSPTSEDQIKIDTDGINDDIVIGVIEQLEKTGNRPHLIKELAQVLSSCNNAVASSANAPALLSSRLATYLRRPTWSALSPCPLGKELIPVHPRKVFYYLTTTSRQDIPPDSSDILSSPLAATSLHAGGKGGRQIISPSLSNASVDDEAENDEERKRDVLSPSPEVDLSTPELDAMVEGTDDAFTSPPTPAGSFSGRSSLARDVTNGSSSSEEINLVHNHRAASPPLEGDEKEFTQTASSMRMRGMSLDESNVRQSKEVENTNTMQNEESEEEKANKNIEDTAYLFGGHHHHAHEAGLGVLSSPMVKAVLENATPISKKAFVEMEVDTSNSILGDQGFGTGWDIKGPETIGLDELDDLLGEF